jgi:hypothetical protein
MSQELDTSIDEGEEEIAAIREVRHRISERFGLGYSKASATGTDREEAHSDSVHVEDDDRALEKILFEHRQVCHQQADLLVRLTLGASPEKDDGRFALCPGGKQGPKIGVRGYDDPVFRLGSIEDDFVVGGSEPVIPNMHRVETGAPKPLGDQGG